MRASTKIAYYYATEIGRAVANKAFEHLIKPIEARMQDATIPYLERALDELGGATTLAEHGLMLIKNKVHDHPLTVHVYHPDDRHTESSRGEAPLYLKVEIDMPYTSLYQQYPFNIFNSELYTSLCPEQQSLNALIIKQDELKRTVTAQVQYKTFKQVSKAWPELTDLIKKIIHLDDEYPISVPFENLLAKFLPMLPAPAPTTEGV